MAEMEEFAAFLEQRRFGDALAAAEAAVLEGAGEIRRAACIVGIIAGSQIGADEKIAHFRQVLTDEAERRYDLEGALRVADGLSSALRSGNPELVRLRFERTSRQRLWTIGMGPIFAAVEAAAGAGKSASAYDFTTSGFAEWQAGLAALAEKKWEEAETHFQEAVERYPVGDLDNEATWSSFDLVLAALFGGNLRLASERARALPTDSTTSSAFRGLAIEIHTAFAEMDIGALDRWIQKFRGMREFQNDFYPRIAENLREVLNDRRAKFEFLLSRPAVLDDAEGLVKVAVAAELPSQPPTLDGIKKIIGLSNRTLAGHLKWRQGRLYLAAFLHEMGAGDGATKCIGAGQIFLNVGGAWHKVNQSRTSAQCNDYCVDQNFLVYRSHKPEEIVIELAGNSVLAEMRDRRVGRFITESRVLFLKIYGGEIVKNLGRDSLNDALVLSNLLTEDVDGQYPFYEKVVRTLLGGKEYSEVDELRYDHIPLLDDLLGGETAADDGVTIPMHLLPKSIDEKIGSVRAQTIGAQMSLQRFGFKPVGKYDALDAGQYLTMTLGTLVNVVETRDYISRRQRKDVLLANPRAHHATIAPTKRAMTDFGCVRALVHQDDNEPGVLEIEEAAANALNLNNGEPVALLKPHTLTPER